MTPLYTSDQLLVFHGAVGTFSGSSWVAPTGTIERAQVNATANVSTGLADQAIGAGATGSRTSTFGGTANLTTAVVAVVQPHTIRLIGTATASGKSTSMKLTFPTGVQVNDQVVVASTEPSTTTVTAPSGYTLVTSVTSGGSSPLATTKVFSHAVATGETSVTLTYSTSVTAQAAVLGIYRGVDPNAPIDVSSTGSAAATTTVTAPSVTPAYSPDQLVIFHGAAGTFSASSWNAPSGTVERAQVNTTANVSTGLADQAIGTGATGTRTSTFGRSANLTAVMVAVAQPPSLLFLHSDQLGTIRILTDSASAVRGTFTFDPYGNVSGSTGSSTTSFGFSGQYRDTETGLIFLRARYYDTATGQFLTRDPLSGATLLPYGYVSGNPLNALDPTGLCDLNPFAHNSCASVVATGLSQLPGAIASDAKQGRDNFIKNVQDPALRPLVAVGAAALVGAAAITAAGLAAGAAGALGAGSLAAQAGGAKVGIMIVGGVVALITLVGYPLCEWTDTTCPFTEPNNMNDMHKIIKQTLTRPTPTPLPSPCPSPTYGPPAPRQDP